jgi:hypothetical protein
VPYQLDDDWSTAAVISYAVIIAVSAFPFFWAVVGAEVTSDEDTHFSGNIVTKLGVAGLLFSPNLCLVSTTLFVLTSTFLHPAIFAFMLLSLVVAPLIGFVLLVRENNAIPWGSMDDAAAKKGPIERTKVWCKLFFATGPWMLVGLAFYVSRALVIKAVWNHWFRVYTGLTYQTAYDKINCRFWNRVTSTALALQYFPQLVLVCIAQTFQVSMLGIVTIVLLALNCVLCAQHLAQHRLQLDAVVEFNLRAADVMLLHFDPRSLDFHDDAPVEQNMVRGTVIFDGEGIELATGVEVLRAAEIVQGRITTVSLFCRASLPAFFNLIVCPPHHLLFPHPGSLGRTRAPQPRRLLDLYARAYLFSGRVTPGQPAASREGHTHLRGRARPSAGQQQLRAGGDILATIFDGAAQRDVPLVGRHEDTILVSIHYKTVLNPLPDQNSAPLSQASADPAPVLLLRRGCARALAETKSLIASAIIDKYSL